MSAQNDDSILMPPPPPKRLKGRNQDEFGPSWHPWNGHMEGASVHSSPCQIITRNPLEVNSLPINSVIESIEASDMHPIDSSPRDCVASISPDRNDASLDENSSKKTKLQDPGITERDQQGRDDQVYQRTSYDDDSSMGSVPDDDERRANITCHNHKPQREKPENAQQEQYPTTRFSDIIGHSHAKLRLDEALLPLALPSKLADSILTGIRAAPASILLYGPPGCGKTQLARAVAGEAQAAFMSIGPSDVLSKFVGESEASIKHLFAEARKRAMEVESRCTVLFFDEIDALGMSRSESSGGSADVGGSDNSSRRVLAELLIQLSKLAHQNEHDITENQHSNLQDCGRLGPFYEAHNMAHQRTDDDLQGASMVDAFASAGAGSNEHQNQSNETIGPMQTDEIYPQARLLVIAATNRPEDCDPALLRRFAIRMLVGLPTFRDRKRIFRRLLTNIDHCIKSHELNQLAEATEEYSGSDLESLAREACMAPIRECLRKAAIHKAKNRKKEQKSGEDCTQENKRPTSKASDESVKEMLLNGLGSLRPVSMDDFELAVSFWVGDYQHTVGYGNRDKTQNRYDSDSSSDEDE